MFDLLFAVLFAVLFELYVLFAVVFGPIERGVGLFGLVFGEQLFEECCVRVRVRVNGCCVHLAVRPERLFGVRKTLFGHIPGTHTSRMVVRSCTLRSQEYGS